MSNPTIAEALAQATSALTASLQGLANAEAGVTQADQAITDAAAQQAVAEQAAADAQAGRDAAVEGVEAAKGGVLGTVGGVRDVLDRLVEERLGVFEPLGVTIANGSAEPVTVDINGTPVTVPAGGAIEV